MEFTIIFPLVVLILLICQYYIVTWSRKARLTANFIPGPRSLPLLGGCLELGRNTVEVYYNLQRLSKKYGAMVKLWMGPYLFVFVADPMYMEHFLSSTVNIKKSMNYEFMQPWLGTGLLTSFGSKWKSRRKIITPAFHFKILEGFIDSFNAKGQTFVSKLQKYVGGPAFDVHEHVTLCALDVMCDAAMGIQLNSQNGKNTEYISALLETADSLVIRSISPWYFPNFIFRMSPLGRKQNALIKLLHNTSYKIIEERKKELNEKKEEEITKIENDVGERKKLAFLDLLLQYNKSGGNLSVEDIREEVDTFMFEGHDTTSSAVSFCLFSLGENPDCQQRAYEELYEIFGDSDREATAEDLTKMKYLECVIKESLRLFPSVPFFLRELDEDVTIEGITFVAGTSIMFGPHMTHKDPKYFPDPEKFDPERFTPENARGRHPYAFVPFSAGPRNCIGQKFAMLEMKALISKVLRNYKISSGGKKNVFCFAMILRTTDGIYIKLENRK